MTTSSSTSVLDQTTDAAFRVWGSEFSAKLAAVGMVQTGDTGQINWVTVVRAAINTAAGYEIWRFSGSFLYLKIEYGSAGATTSPQMWITVGSGSNGTGTITGQLSTRSTFCAGAAPGSTVTSYTSRWCHVDSVTGCALSVSWKEVGAGAVNNQAFLVVGGTVTGGGFTLSTGFGVCRMFPSTGSMSKQCVRLAATAVTYNDVVSDLVVPGDPNTSSTASTGNQQAYQIPMNVPDVLPFAWACTVLLTEAVRGSTILVAMVGSTTRTYISTGQLSNQAYGANYTSGRYCPAMIYE